MKILRSLVEEAWEWHGEVRAEPGDSTELEAKHGVSGEQ